MLHEKKYIIIIVGVLIVVGTGIAIYFIHKGSPRNVIENTLAINLPSSAKITDYTSYKNRVRVFYAKILCEAQNVNALKDQLNKKIGIANDDQYEIYKHSGLYDFKKTCEWWDLDNNYIVEYYHKYINVEKRNIINGEIRVIPKQINIFISKNQEGQYYLYIAYY